MNCMKCGRETETEQVFCADCLAEMEKYPVKPDVVVQLPHRNEGERHPAPRRRSALTVEEQLAKMKRKVWNYRITSMILIVLAVLLSYMVYRFADELDFQRFLGQNYSTVETTEATEPEAPSETLAETEPAA